MVDVYIDDFSYMSTVDLYHSAVVFNTPEKWASETGR
jgi:hypothetical protein